MDDWEKELEEDRKRMAAGQNIDDGGHKSKEDDDDTAGYAGMMSYSVDNDNPAPVYQPPSASTAPVQTKEDMESVEAFYANYEANANATPDMAANSGAGKQALSFVPLQNSLKGIFGSKFGQQLYFCESVTMYVKGFFSPNTENYIMFLTPNAVYFGDGDTGEIVLSRGFAKLNEVLWLGDQGVGFRFGAYADICITMTVGRSQLQNVLPAVVANTGISVPFHSRSSEYEKGYRKDIKYLDRKNFQWDVEEDPRTGMRLVEVPEQHVPYYYQLVPKILHWFGGVNHVMKDWKGSLVQERRGAWVTATSFFMCFPSGPQDDGRSITKCIGIEFIGELLSGVGGAMAIICSSGPKQDPLTLMFDDMETKERVIQIFSKAYRFRRFEEMKVRRVDSIDKAMKIEKASDKKLKPELFVMKTRADLLALLKSKTKKK